jgi:tetratricopeptide (TPR) repeat protein
MPEIGLQMAEAALALNPTGSASLWNVRGDCLNALERVEEARQAYERALEINPSDVEAHNNLACVHGLRYEDAVEALRWIAAGLACDPAGKFRDLLLKVQGEVLDRLQQQHQQRSQRLATRISHPAAPDPG